MRAVCVLREKLGSNNSSTGAKRTFCDQNQIEQAIVNNGARSKIHALPHTLIDLTLDERDGAGARDRRSLRIDVLQIA